MASLGQAKGGRCVKKCADFELRRVSLLFLSCSISSHDLFSKGGVAAVEGGQTLGVTVKVGLVRVSVLIRRQLSAHISSLVSILRC